MTETVGRRVVGPCRNWNGATSHGYGRVSVGGKVRQAHRVIYEIEVGPIPAGLEIDHLCRNRACVNAAHLEPVTHGENVIRGIGPTAVHAAQTHCIHGHAFDAVNTRIEVSRRGARRACRACNRAAVRRCKARRRGALA